MLSTRAKLAKLLCAESRPLIGATLYGLIDFQ